MIAALLAVSFGAQWYADEVLLLRYCDRPEAALRRLVAIDAGSGVVPGESRRDLMLAARLEYLVPRGVGEPVDAYVGRVRKVLAIRCGAGILGKESLYILLA